MERFEEFLTERKYLKNVSDKTLVYYRCAFRSGIDTKGMDRAGRTNPVPLRRFVWWRRDYCGRVADDKAITDASGSIAQFDSLARR